jgi:hypothetical protein
MYKFEILKYFNCEKVLISVIYAQLCITIIFLKNALTTFDFRNHPPCTMAQLHHKTDIAQFCTRTVALALNFTLDG